MTTAWRNPTGLETARTRLRGRQSHAVRGARPAPAAVALDDAGRPQRQRQVDAAAGDRRTDASGRRRSPLARRATPRAGSSGLAQRLLYEGHAAGWKDSLDRARESGAAGGARRTRRRRRRPRRPTRARRSRTTGAPAFRAAVGRAAPAAFAGPPVVGAAPAVAARRARHRARRRRPADAGRTLLDAHLAARRLRAGHASRDPCSRCRAHRRRWCRAWASGRNGVPARPPTGVFGRAVLGVPARPAPGDALARRAGTDRGVLPAGDQPVSRCRSARTRKLLRADRAGHRLGRRAAGEPARAAAAVRRRPRRRHPRADGARPGPAAGADRRQGAGALARHRRCRWCCWRRWPGCSSGCPADATHVVLAASLLLGTPILSWLGAIAAALTLGARAAARRCWRCWCCRWRCRC